MFKYFNYTGWENRPSIEEMTKNISLSLINTHFTIGTVKPLVPNIKEVAGMHLKPALKLLKGLQELMDNLTDGVVYISFGSVITPTQLLKYQLKVFMRQLGQIKQNVLWEWESNDLPKLPSNVIVNKSFPQKDILGHLNCVLFTPHSDSILNTEEAIYYGVPMLTISVFEDQQYNSIMMESKGATLRIKYADLTEHLFRNSLHKILNNASFKENAIKLSKLFHDQPMKPLDLAVYWVEYVISHNGAHHLKTAGNQLNWFQFMLIDVIFEFIIFILIFIFILYYILEKMYKTFMESDESDTDTDNNKKKE
ncbi:UDP-glucuronosyltransferase 2C1-like isoform X2 [Sipha flava]|nr:UDP-glucuronosyltransferase 2C1-like isoform X2 [Sipha flava]